MRTKPPWWSLAIALVAIGLLAIWARPAKAPGVSPAPAATSRHARVSMRSFAFEPSELKVPVGTTVDWIDVDGKHAVTFDGSGVPDDPKDVLDVGGTVSRTFNTPGRYPYHCPAHGGSDGQGMWGVVIVTPE